MFSCRFICYYKYDNLGSKTRPNSEVFIYMEERIIGPYVVHQEVILDPEGEIIYYKVNSPMFKGKPLNVMYEEDVTEELIEQHLLGLTGSGG